MSARPPETGQRNSPGTFFSRLPYWLILASFIGLLFLWNILTDENYKIIFSAVAKGVGVTIYVTIVAFAGAIVFGLLIGLARLSHNRLLLEVTSFYVEIVRGIPMLVLLYYIAFVGAPGLIHLINWMGMQMVEMGLTAMGTAWAEFSIRELDFATRAILALIIGYSAFISEVFRAGIESVDPGQSEAAVSLGMNRLQTMRFVVLPQAVRRVLPPLGNNFIAMLKDSALVSVLGVQDITQMGKVYSASTFRFFETYNVVAFLYLIMTIALALLVRYLERRMASE